MDQEGNFTYETDFTVAESDDDKPNFKGEPQDETARQTLKKLGGTKGACRAQGAYDWVGLGAVWERGDFVCGMCAAHV